MLAITVKYGGYDTVRFRVIYKSNLHIFIRNKETYVVVEVDDVLIAVEEGSV